MKPLLLIVTILAALLALARAKVPAPCKPGDRRGVFIANMRMVGCPRRPRIRS
jgi:hypothetical protein